MAIMALTFDLEESVMSTVSISQLKDRLSEYLNRVAFGRERIIVASHGKPKAAVISLSDLELLEELEDAQAAREALAEYEQGETIPLEQMIEELAEAPYELSG
jgi:prevent-host-death family protein